MNQYDEKINQYISEKEIILERIIFEGEVRTAEESCKYTGANPESNVKTVLLLSKEDKEIYSVIIRCKDKVNIKKLEETYNKKMYFMPWLEVEKYVGYPPGGVPPFGYEAKFIINADLEEDEQIYVGGGTTNSIIRIKVAELKKVISPKTLDIILKN